MTETREGTGVVERSMRLLTDDVSIKLWCCVSAIEANLFKGVAMDTESLRTLASGFEAAHAEITRLRSENEALKEALRPFFDGFSYDPGHSDLDNEQPISVRVQLGDWRRARRHLTARKEGQGGGA